MVISRTPFRISFFGGGTDYPGWYRKRGGAVLAATIDKYCYLTCRHLPPFFEHRTRVVYSKIEAVQTPEEITHPAVRAALQFMKIRRGIEVHHDGDLPARSGMGSSSAFTVGLLHALHALKSHMPTRERLASEAIHVEQELLQEAVGSQDQILAAYGGFNFITFATNGAFQVQPVITSPRRLNELRSHLLLFYTGIRRTASDIASTFLSQIMEKEQQLTAMRALVDEALHVLNSKRSLLEFGHLMHQNWLLKCGLSAKVSNVQVEELYQQARDAGALGGKLTGAGGGGFLLLFAPPAAHEAIRLKLSRLIHVPFQFSYGGSQIIFHDQDQDYSAVERRRSMQKLEEFRELAALP